MARHRLIRLTGVLAAALLLGLGGCGDDDGEDAPDNGADTAAETAEDDEGATNGAAGTEGAQDEQAAGGEQQADVGQRPEGEQARGEGATEETAGRAPRLRPFQLLRQRDRRLGERVRLTGRVGEVFRRRGIFEVGSGAQDVAVVRRPGTELRGRLVEAARVVVEGEVVRAERVLPLRRPFAYTTDQGVTRFKADFSGEPAVVAEVIRVTDPPRG